MRNKKRTNKNPCPDLIKSQNDFFDFFSKWGDVKKKRPGLLLKTQNEELLILSKNVTYLGHPHPFFKKRIQIPGTWRQHMSSPKTIILGVYTQSKHKQEGSELIVLYANTDFITKKANNSSAHIYTTDLKKADSEGYFSKVDKKNNFVQVFTRNKFDKFLKNLANDTNKITTLNDQKEWYQNYSDKFYQKNIKTNPKKVCMDYAKTILNENWNGKKAYNEMVKANYRNMLQAEWPGFYNQFLFENFIKREGCEGVVSAGDDDSELDLDLTFLKTSKKVFLGDLKTHTKGSGAIITNDQGVIDTAVKKYGKVWFFVVEHDTEKDIDHGLVVRDHWNKLKRETGIGNPTANYATRMKNNVTIKNVLILEVTLHNHHYLSDFQTGMLNSNGTPRAPKYKINIRDIEHFVYYRSEHSFSKPRDKSV